MCGAWLNSSSIIWTKEGIYGPLLGQVHKTKALTLVQARELKLRVQAAKTKASLKKGLSDITKLKALIGHI